MYIFFNNIIFTTSLILLESTETSNNLSTSNFTLFYKLLKLVDTFFKLSMSNLSTSDFKSAKSVFLAKHDVSTPAVFFKSVFVA